MTVLVLVSLGATEVAAARPAGGAAPLGRPAAIPGGAGSPGQAVVVAADCSPFEHAAVASPSASTDSSVRVFLMRLLMEIVSP
jgi:hypothetical protein